MALETFSASSPTKLNSLALEEEFMHSIRMFTELSDAGNMCRLTNILNSMFVNSCHSMSQQAADMSRIDR